MTVQIVRFTTTEAHVPEIDGAAAAMLAALGEARPDGVRYAATRLDDGVTYLLILELAEGVENPLPAIPAARAFQQGMARWATQPPAPEPVTVLGSYGLFAWHDGPAHDGPAHDGSAHGGPAHEGAAHGGPARGGPAPDGSARS